MQYQFSNKEEFDLIPDGDYEVILNAERAETSTGKEKLNCKFTIRNDVEQGNKGRVIYDSIWRDKENPSQYDHKKLQKILLTQGPTGKYMFADEDELIQHINGLTMRIHININEPDGDYHDSQWNEVKYCSYRVSNAKPKTLGSADDGVAYAKQILGDNVTITDEDLPF